MTVILESFSTVVRNAIGLKQILGTYLQWYLNRVMAYSNLWNIHSFIFISALILDFVMARFLHTLVEHTACKIGVHPLHKVIPFTHNYNTIQWNTLRRGI